MRAIFITVAAVIYSISIFADREDFASIEGLTVKSSKGFWIAPGESTRLEAFAGGDNIPVLWEQRLEGAWVPAGQGPRFEYQAEHEHPTCGTVEHTMRATINNRPGPKPLEFVIRVQEPICTLTSKDGLAHDAVTKVVVGMSGTVIAGTENGLTLLQWPELKAATFRVAGDKRPIQIVSALSQRANGELWIGVARSFLGPFPVRGFGIEVFDASKNDPWKKQPLLPTSYAASITFGTTQKGDTFPVVLTTNNYAYFGGSKGGLYVRNLSQNQMEGNSLNAILPLEPGLWLIGSDQGLDVYEGGSLDRISSPEWTGVGSVYAIGSRQNVRALAMDQDQNLWVGLKGDRGESLIRIQNTGALVKESKRLKRVRNRHLGEPFFLPTRAGKEVRALIVDDENNLWIATNSGLVKRSPNGLYSVLQEKDGLRSSDVQDLYYDAKLQYLWIATKKGLSRFSLKQL